jgi:hypothetical protein
MTRNFFSWCVTTLCLCLGAVAGGAHAAPLTLGSAANFGVLGSTTVTNTGSTVVNGSVGLTPGTSVTGFPPGTIVGGALHINDASAVTAKADANAAYAALNALACSATYGAPTDLSALSPIAPGVYCFTSTVSMTGPVTLSGGANDQFVFKIASALNVANGATMTLAGGATACNVFYGVGSSATLGTTSTLAGSLLANTSVTLNTGASLGGGAYALNGAVTLDTNRVQTCGSYASLLPGANTTNSIPTLSEWSLMLLAGLMMLFGLVQVRRHRGRTPA